MPVCDGPQSQSDHETGNERQQVERAPPFYQKSEWRAVGLLPKRFHQRHHRAIQPGKPSWIPNSFSGKSSRESTKPDFDSVRNRESAIWPANIKKPAEKFTSLNALLLSPTHMFAWRLFRKDDSDKRRSRRLVRWLLHPFLQTQCVTKSSSPPNPPIAAPVGS